MEGREKAIKEGIQIFDRKPIVVKSWRLGIEINKETVNKVPI